MQENYLAFIVIAIIVIVFVGKYVVDYHHEINKRNRYMEVQIRLLTQIAAAQGVSSEKIAEIVASARIPKPATLKTS